MRTLNIHIDGAARGNPGPAAFAYVITREGELPVECAGRLGEATNNIAEYTALVRALTRAAELGAERLHIRSDSELLVKQMNGEYKVKNASLRTLYDQAQELAAPFQEVTIQHVRREQNKRADQLCNDVLDGRRHEAPEEDDLSPPPAPHGRPVPGKRASPATRAALLAILRKTAAQWSRGKAVVPTVEEVCDEVWELLLAEGVIRLSLEE